MKPDETATTLDDLEKSIRRCRICVDTPDQGRALSHEPRPVLQVSATARICIASQAPGIRAHESGVPFSDPSGVRLRQWMAIDEMTFYDRQRIAILPMGFCFPGQDAQGSDLPPRRECARAWRLSLLSRLPELRLLLLVGGYAQRWHLQRMDVARELSELNVNDTVAHWREIHEAQSPWRAIVLPHPSWRNSGWIKRNAWFEAELLPMLRQQVNSLL
ncbi:MAG: uracil-DNA glycosylase family protein [Proteobacteria bacterium]|nr:uracil-DNA glycosylase family protein [Pseudomonadota bacterium]HQR04716.1 uracil-DNA glycosylase family protein [Rhodocyclaceae bacterium]